MLNAAEKKLAAWVHRDMALFDDSIMFSLLIRFGRVSIYLCICVSRNAF